MTDRVAIFIDGPSLYGVGKALGLDIDFKKLPALLMEPGEKLVRPYYYAVTAEDGEFEAVMPLLDFLEFNGFTVRRRPGRTYIDPTSNTRRVRGTVVTELAVEAMASALFFDRAVIVSSDGELEPLVDGLQRIGKRVTVMSTIRLCADELRRQADDFIDFENVRGKLARPARPSKETAAA